MHCTCRSVLSGAFALALNRTQLLPPSFLLPAFAAQSSSFSTSASHSARRRKCGNPYSGVSALRHTGFKQGPLSRYTYEDLPKPVLDPAQRSAVTTDENHGLWQFFYENRASMATPQDIAAHGRAWTVAELRVKDWHDLHKLWWVCAKELNRLRTFDEERLRAGDMYGGYESSTRADEIKKTQKAIKHTLTERWYAWENARDEAMLDPTVNLYANTEEGEIVYQGNHKARKAKREFDAEALQKLRGQTGSPVMNS